MGGRLLLTPLRRSLVLRLTLRSVPQSECLFDTGSLFRWSKISLGIVGFPVMKG